MRSSRRAVTAVASIALVAASVATGARAASSTVLYVDGSAASCTESGTGTQAAPYCTIQAAANAAVAGDTVDIAAGTYTGALTIASQGTAAAPIVFQAVGGKVAINATSGQTGDHVTFDGASYVTFEGIEGTGTTGPEMYTFSTLVENSSHVTLDGTYGWVEVSGTSSDVTVSRTIALTGAGITVDSGSSGDVISGNWLYGAHTAISVTGATSAAITGNTIQGDSVVTATIGIYGASTGVTVENNVMTIPSPHATAEIAVDSAAAAGTTVDYNVLWPHSAIGPVIPAYSWAGTDYSTASDFYKATGQGAHDLVADPDLQVGDYTATPTAPQINSANSSAPGMLSTDMYGAACHVEPVVAITGAGSPAYCARGAVQAAYTSSVDAAATPVTALSVSLASSMEQHVTFQGSATEMFPVPTPAVTYAVSWGDGKSANYQASGTQSATTAAHTYARAGTYTITDTAHLTDGSSVSTTTSFATAGSDYTPFGPTRILDTRKGIGAPQAKVAAGSDIQVQVSGADSIPSNVTAVAVNLTVTNATGGGYLAAVQGGPVTTSTLNYAKGQTVANGAIVPVSSTGSIDVVNVATSGSSADVIIDVTGYFTQQTGNGWSPVTLKRILDTRNGTGATKTKVAAGGHVSLAIAGADAIPGGVVAVALHVTETDATGGGWIAAEADGGGVPTTSSLNYSSGQTISNTVIAPVAADGRIEFYNGALTGSVDLIADVSGFFSATSTAAYVPITAYRIFDSRLDGELLPYATLPPVSLAQTDGTTHSVFPTGSTMVTNLTVTQVAASGNVIVYPTGTARPAVSDDNFLKGQTVADLAVLPTEDSGQDVDAYNASAGITDLIIDETGYFATS